MKEHQRNWHPPLPNSLWDEKVTPKTSLGNYPFFLVYGKEVIIYITYPYFPAFPAISSIYPGQIMSNNEINIEHAP
jgi:hypothetical protein